MAEDKTLAPPLFRGTIAENGEDWYRHFENYCSYKEMAEPKKLALFKVLIIDLAGDWLASLPDGNTNSYAAIKQAFDARYKVPEMVKYRSAKDLFSRKQQEAESVDDFCAGLQKAARVIGADEKTTVYAALNGISPNLVGYITQRKPNTMAELLEAARVAELTIPIPKTADNAVSSQIFEVKAEMQKLNEKWERVAVNAARNEGEDKAQRSVSFLRSSMPPRSGNRFPARRFPGGSSLLSESQGIALGLPDQ